MKQIQRNLLKMLNEMISKTKSLKKSTRKIVRNTKLIKNNNLLNLNKQTKNKK